MLHYFGETYKLKLCCSCDNCTTNKDKVDITDSVLMALQSIEVLKENFAGRYIRKFLSGDITQEVQDYKHDMLDLFGKGSQHDKIYWNSVLNHILLEDFVQKDIENYGVLKLTADGRAFIQDPYPISVAINHQYDDALSFTEAEPEPAVLDELLFGMLKDLRKKVGKQKKVPPYVVFQERSLEEMATYYPISIEEMENITGVSKGKAIKYGREFIQLIKTYVEENEVERAADFVMKSVGTKSKSKIYIIQNIDKKIPLETIAKNLDLKLHELMAEMEKIVDSGTRLNIDYYINNQLDEDQQSEIFDYFMTANSDSAIDALKELGADEYSEEEIRWVRIQLMSTMAH